MLNSYDTGHMQCILTKHPYPTFLILFHILPHKLALCEAFSSVWVGGSSDTRADRAAGPWSSRLKLTKLKHVSWQCT